MNNKFDDWTNNVLANWSITVVFGANLGALLLIIGDIAFMR